MHNNATKLLFLLSATSGLFMITHEKTSISDVPAIDGVDISVIDNGLNARVYGAFVEHAINKFHGNGTTDQIREEWSSWSAINVSLEGKLMESFFIPISDTINTEEDSFASIGVSKDREVEISEGLAAIENSMNTDEVFIPEFISKASHIARSHAELMIIGVGIGYRSASTQISDIIGDEE